jgi:hypothetical protein
MATRPMCRRRLKTDPVSTVTDRVVDIGTSSRFTVSPCKAMRLEAGVNDVTDALTSGMRQGSTRVFNAVLTRVFLNAPICVVSSMRTTPTRRHWPSLTRR